MSSILIVVGLTALYLVAQEFLRRQRPLFMWTCFGLIPLAMTPYWFQSNDLDIFLLIKIYSIMFCICWAVWLRYSEQRSNPWLLRSIGFLLAANILEAVSVDLLKSDWSHHLNALSGVLLTLTLPFVLKRTTIQNTKHRDLRLDIPLPWIVGYTGWNWVFVYLNYPSFTGHHFAILAAALIVALVDRQRWVQARAATLGLSLLPTASNYSGMLSIIDATSWFDEAVAGTAAIVVVAWIATHVCVTFQKNLVKLTLRQEWPGWWTDRRYNVSSPTC